MKKIFLLIGVLAQIPVMNAQNISDGVRYTIDNLDGTARFISMGGAFGALGGDLSSLKVNPAGSSVFLTNQASFSLGVNAYDNSTTFGNGFDSRRNNDFDLNQAGVVFVFNNNRESAKITRLSFGITYNRKSTFENRFKAIGQNEETIGDHFLDYAQEVPLDLFTTRDNESPTDLYDYLGSTAGLGFNNSRLQTAYLGYEAYLFDAVNNDPENTAYLSNVSGDSFEHHYYSYERGLNGKVTFNGGIAIQDRFFFGLNLNSHFLDYRQTTTYDEFIAGPSEINEINYDNYLDTKGSGFSFQVGGIAKLNDVWRVAISYESPTWYSISEETTQFLRTDSKEFGDAVVEPNITNVYPDYNLRTPGQLNAGIAAILGGHGLISFDYSYKDYSNIAFTSDGFDPVNADIGDHLQEVNTYRIGGEYRLKGFSFRAGFRYQDSPYKDKTIGDLRGYSAGLGYNFGSFRLDFGYDLAKRDYNRSLLHTGFEEQASIENSLSHYVLTLAFAL